MKMADAVEAGMNSITETEARWDGHGQFVGNLTPENARKDAELDTWAQAELEKEWSKIAGDEMVPGDDALPYHEHHDHSDAQLATEGHGGYESRARRFGRRLLGVFGIKRSETTHSHDYHEQHPWHEHDHHDHEHTVDVEAEHRARRYLFGGAIGSLILALGLEHRYGISEDLHGLVANGNHNVADGKLHFARALAIGARLAGQNAKNRLLRESTTYVMAVVTGVSAAHIGEAVWDLAQDPSTALTTNTDLLTKEAALSAASITANTAIAVSLAHGTKGSSVEEEVGDHSSRDVVESAAFAATFVNEGVGAVVGAGATAWGVKITNKMANNVESDKEVGCGHEPSKTDTSPHVPFRQRLRNLPYKVRARVDKTKFDFREFMSAPTPEAKRTRRRKLIAVGVGVVAMGTTAYLAQKSAVAPDMSARSGQVSDGSLLDNIFDVPFELEPPEVVAPAESPESPASMPAYFITGTWYLSNTL